MKNKNTTTVPVSAALAAALSEIGRQFGDGIIRRLDSCDHLEVETISTGNIAADFALGVGGLPKGRIVEVFGPESSGKTSLCLSVIAASQRTGGVAAFIDVEHALDPKWAKTCGVNVAELFVSQPDCGEDALTIVEQLVRSNEVDVIVLDSVAALVPKSELEGQMGDASVGTQARMMGQAMRRLVGVIAKSKCLCIFTNQLREKIGVMYGPVEYQPGGRALKFASTVRIDLRRKELIKSGDGLVTGARTKVKVVKNKVAAPFGECEVDLDFAEGLSNSGSLLDLGVEHRLVERKGAWFARKGEMIGQGRDAAKKYLREHPAVAAEIEQALRAGPQAEAQPGAAEPKAA